MTDYYIKLYLISGKNLDIEIKENILHNLFYIILNFLQKNHDPFLIAENISIINPINNSVNNFDELIDLIKKKININLSVIFTEVKKIKYYLNNKAYAIKKKNNYLENHIIDICQRHLQENKTYKIKLLDNTNNFEYFCSNIKSYNYEIYYNNYIKDYDSSLNIALYNYENYIDFILNLDLESIIFQLIILEL